jgi:hypothetical protein
VTRCPNTIRHLPPPGPARDARRPVNATTHPAPTADSGRAWLRNAMAALAVLAAAAAVVSWDAQYVMVRQARRVPAIAALEAGIPDVGALIFAALGVALALHGRVMPAAVYALASDTLIGVVRAWALARMHATGQALAGEEVTPLAVAGAVLLWLLRLALAPASTLTGFRRWTLDECPVAPGRKAPAAQPTPPTAPPADVPPALPLPRRRADGRPRKQDLLIALASQRHDLRRVPLNRVARIAGEIGAEVSLHQGTARRVLRTHVQALQHQATPVAETEATP